MPPSIKPMNISVSPKIRLARETTILGNKPARVSVIKTLFPKIKYLPYNSVQGYNKSMSELKPLLLENKLNRLLLKSFREDVKHFGVDDTVHRLMDYICVKSLDYRHSPLQDYFDPDTLPSKMRTAGWTEKEIKALDGLIHVKRTLDHRFSAISHYLCKLKDKVEKESRRIKELEKDPKQNKENIRLLKILQDNLRKQREINLDSNFRGTQRKWYNNILEEDGIINPKYSKIKNDIAKKKLSLQILKVLYAQRNMVIPGTLGYDIRSVYNEVRKSLGAVQKKSYSYFRWPQDKSLYDPYIVALLGDGEVLHFINLATSTKNNSCMMLTNRKILMTHKEWKAVENSVGPTKKYEVVNEGSFYSSLYRKDKNLNKVGFFMDAYQFATKDDTKKESERWTDFMMKYSELIKRKYCYNPLFKKTVDKYNKNLQPIIDNVNMPIIFYDTGLKGTFPGLLAALCEMMRGKNHQASLFGGIPTAHGFIYAIDENLTETFPHYKVGRDKCRFIEDAPRFCVYDRGNNKEGVTLNNPALNMLALIYYHTFLQLK